MAQLVAGQASYHVRLVVATFLPIKTALLAAEQRAPEFVPGLLSDQGQHTTANVRGMVALQPGP